MQPLFDLILRHVAPPTVEDGRSRMIGTHSGGPIPISAASSPAASPPAPFKANQAVRCWAATAS